MPASPNMLRWAAVMACVAPGLLRGQDLRVVDSFTWLAAAYDANRGCTVTIGFAGETCEVDGAAVRYRPLPLLSVWPGGFVRGPDGRSLLLVANDDVQTITSRFDGVAWQQVAGTGPSRRTGFAIACDEARGEVLLFGGYDLSLWALGDTWTFDGATWTQRQPAPAPSARMGAAAVFDSARARVVMFGGNGASGAFADTWEWNGVTWAAATPQNTPSGRAWPGLVYDAARSRTVLFGGVVGAVLHDDTWEYDGIDWSATQPPLPLPSARLGPHLVYDPVLGETVMLGGSDSAFLRDAWTWNGVRWQAIAVPPAPNPRSGLAFADPAGTGLIVADYQQNPTTWRWDASGWTALASAPPVRRLGAATCVDTTRVFVFGGWSPVTAAVLHDLWAFDGTNWSMLANGGPSPRIGAAMASDLASGNLVLFGGNDLNNVQSGDTWTFDGVAWTQQQPASAPSARTGAAAAYDFVRQRVVLFGGFGMPAGLMNDTWEWNGVNWAPVVSTTAPPSDGALSLAFDLTRARTVLVRSVINPSTVTAWSLEPSGWQPIAVGPPSTISGFSSSTSAHGFPYLGGLLLADAHHVYALSAQQAEVEPFGAACTATAALLAANAWPRLGALDFAIEVVGAPANSFVALVGAVQSASLPVGGCTLLVQPGQLALLLGTSGAGFTSAPLPVPTASGLLGVELFFQAASLEATAPAGFTLSRGLRLRVGD